MMKKIQRLYEWKIKTVQTVSIHSFFKFLNSMGAKDRDEHISGGPIVAPAAVLGS